MSGAASAVEGGCQCGAVRFRIDLPPKWCAHCHCSMCRRAHGAGFVTWVGLESGRFRLLSGAAELKRYQSSAQATRSFCGRCGTMLFFESARWSGEIHLTLAHLDSAEGITPQAHAYWSSRVPWVDLADDGLPKVEPTGHA
jgi:hypothetical protein